VYLNIPSFQYSSIAFWVFYCAGIYFHFCLIRHNLWQVTNLAKGKLLYRFYAFTLLKPYAFIPNYLFVDHIFFPIGVHFLLPALKLYGK